MNRKWITPSVILGVAGLAIYWLTSHQPSVSQHTARGLKPVVVEVTVVQPQDYLVQIESFGAVQPRMQSALVNQVGGTIVHLSDRLRPGSFFSQGDLLLRIDARDHATLVKLAKAELQDAVLALAQEQARGRQASLEWEQLGLEESPTELNLRRPQLQTAEARVEAARARLAQTQLDLARTEIVAPYDGRVLNLMVDEGQVVTANSKLADIFATDRFEVRLPIRNEALPWLHLPEAYTNQKEQPKTLPRVTFINPLVPRSTAWQGMIVRTESAIDASTQQLHVIAEILEPFKKVADRPPLKIGQYVHAYVHAQAIPDALVVPAQSVYPGGYLYLLQQGRLQRTSVEVLWQNDQDLVIRSGLAPGDQVVLTPLGQISSGTAAILSSAVSKESEHRTHD